MKVTIYEVCLYPNGHIVPEITTWRLFTKTKDELPEKKKQRKKIYLHLEEQKAA